MTSQATSDAMPAWSPDGKLIAFTSTNPDSLLPIYAIPELRIVDVDTGESRVIEALRETQPFALDFTPDGDSVVAIMETRGEQSLVMVNVASGAVQSLVDGSDVVYRHPSPDALNGTQLAHGIDMEIAHYQDPLFKPKGWAID